jgi:hypothetical protein
MLEQLYEELSTALIETSDHLLSFQFYILSGRFNIQHILDVYLEPLLAIITAAFHAPVRADNALLAAAALFTASVQRFVQAGVFKTDVNFLFAAYIFLRITQSSQVSFEDFVNQNHTWQYDEKLTDCA